MIKNAWLVLAFAMTFGLGYAVSQGTTATPVDTPKLKGVTGIGGVFFKSKDPKKIKAWYHEHLGLPVDQYGTNFEWWEGPDSTKKGSTQWAPFSASTKYFEPSTKEYMINYRVDNLTALVDQLKGKGVTIVDTLESYDYGKFIHIMDIEGTKIELWESIDTD